MGTRIYVEIWADDQVKGEAAIDAVMDEMRHIDDTNEHLQADQRGSPGSMRSRPGSRFRSAWNCSAAGHGARVIRAHRGRNLIFTYASVGYMYDFREHKRPTEGQIQARVAGSGTIGTYCSTPKDALVRFSQPVFASIWADRQGLFGRSRHRIPAGARYTPRGL